MLEIAGLLGPRKITAGHFLDDPESGHVMRKLGFVPTGRAVRRFSKRRGEDVPCALYRLCLDECEKVAPIAA